MILFAYIDCMSFSSRAEERVVQLCWWWFRIRSANIHVPLDMKALTYLLCLIMPYSNTECPTLFGGIICLILGSITVYPKPSIVMYCILFIPLNSLISA